MNVLAADTYDILVDYHDGVLSVSKWLVILVVAAIVAVGSRGGNK